MNTTYEIKETSKLIEFLDAMGIEDPVVDSNYQLPTNHGFVHELANGQIVFLPHDLSGDGLLVSNKVEFDKIIENDKFPIENPTKTIFENETNLLLNLPQEIHKYQQYLNETLKFEFEDISKESAQAYLKKIVGRSIKQVATDKEKVALIIMFGHLIKQEVNGTWMLEKIYGKYNPYYEPLIKTDANKIILLTSTILGLIKWKVTSIDSVFNDAIHDGIDIETYKKYKELIVLE
jgi:hypothetical protein